jgi:hypothetical protein
MRNNSLNFLGNQGPKPELAFITFEETDENVCLEEIRSNSNSKSTSGYGSDLDAQNLNLL